MGIGGETVLIVWLAIVIFIIVGFITGVVIVKLISDIRSSLRKSEFTPNFPDDSSR